MVITNNLPVVFIILKFYSATSSALVSCMLFISLLYSDVVLKLHEVEDIDRRAIEQDDVSDSGPVH